MLYALHSFSQKWHLRVCKWNFRVCKMPLWMQISMKIKEFWVMLGCAISSIARSKHGCTGGWLILWCSGDTTVLHLSDWCMYQSGHNEYMFLITFTCHSFLYICDAGQACWITLHCCQVRSTHWTVSWRMKRHLHSTTTSAYHWFYPPIETCSWRCVCRRLTL